MKLFENLVQKVKPYFEGDGKLHRFHYAFEAIETLFFVPGTETESGTHIRDGIDLKRTMFMVVLALIPTLLFGIWNVGHQHFLAVGQYGGALEGFADKVLFGLGKVLPIVVVSYGVGLAIEIAFAIFRKHPVNEGFFVTGMLIPLIMPPTIPLWMVALATAFAVILGKEAFGGTGMNILNIALLARVFLFFAYPTYMSGEAVWVAGNPMDFIDGFSGATPLGVAYLNGASGLAAAQPFDYGLTSLIIGTVPGSIGETSVVAILIGAVLLLITGIASWRIMGSVVIGAFGMATLFTWFDLSFYQGVPAVTHLAMGSMLFATVFMATDPVTGAQTHTGKIIYGLLIGMFGMIIRTLNPAYPDGWMLAILLMNVFAPTIDHFVVQSNIKRRMSRAL